MYKISRLAEVEQILGHSLEGAAYRRFRSLCQAGYANPYDIVNALRKAGLV